MFLSRCGEVFKGAICPRCQKQFFICRHCDRGQVYCCRKCSSLSRFEKCRIYRQRYRQSKEGQKDHRDRKRERRRRKILSHEIVGDQTYKEMVSSGMVFAPKRLADVLAVIGRVGKTMVKYFVSFADGDPNSSISVTERGDGEKGSPCFDTPYTLTNIPPHWKQNSDDPSIRQLEVPAAHLGRAGRAHHRGQEQPAGGVDHCRDGLAVIQAQLVVRSGQRKR